MSVEFYRINGVLWFRATAGGHGGDATSSFEGRATDDDLTQHARDYQRFLAREREAAPISPDDLPQDAAPLPAAVVMDAA